MGKYDFNEIIERKGSGALKTDSLLERFGTDDLLAAWVADMDFKTPDFIVDALKKRLQHPIFGYSPEPAEFKKSIIDWEKEIHDREINPEWISYIPGIVKGIGMVINVFTKEGDDVVIMPPVYHPFRITTEQNKRRLVTIPLIEKEGEYFINIGALSNLKTEGGIFLLSNPHNPGGKIWSKEELKELAKICREKGLLVVSDEIHADMALWGKKSVPFMTVSKDAFENSITFCAPSKTFNIPGIVCSYSIIPNKNIRDKFYTWLKANELDEAPIFSYLALMAAYKNGKEWRKEMLAYVEGNIRYVEEFFRTKLPDIVPLRPDASFLVWLDCRRLGMTGEELVDLFVNHAKVALNDGSMFGKEGEGFMRLNVATPLENLKKILNRIEKGIIEKKL